MCGRSLVLRPSVVDERSIFREGVVGSASDADSSSDDTEAAETNEISQMKGLDYSMMVCRLKNIIPEEFLCPNVHAFLYIP